MTPLEALKPFALAAEDLDERTHDWSEVWEMPAAMGITAGDLRNAARVYASADTHPKGGDVKQAPAPLSGAPKGRRPKPHPKEAGASNRPGSD
jgi:hypothetical protein